MRASGWAGERGSGIAEERESERPNARAGGWVILGDGVQRGRLAEMRASGQAARRSGGLGYKRLGARESGRPDG